MFVRHGARAEWPREGLQQQGPARSVMVDRGTFLGVWHLLLRLLLCFIYRLIQCKNAEAIQETEGDASPPCHPTRMCLQIPISSFSMLLPDRSLWHYVLILPHSVMVSTGGGDSPLLIHAGPSLLVVGLFFRGKCGVGFALPIWWKAENLGLRFVR